MLFLRISLLAALGFGFNTATASDILETTSPAYFQGEPLMVAGRPGKRRRSDGCDMPPNAWAIDFCEDGSFCYVKGEEAKLWLWLPETKRSGNRKDRVTITNTHDNQSAPNLPWKKDKATLLWPVKDMPIKSGTTYKIKLKKGRNYFSRQITLHQIPADLSRDEQVSQMRQKGCKLQAYLLEDQTG